MEKVLNFDSGEFLNRAKTAVFNLNKHKVLPMQHLAVHTVWFCKTLENWKALLCTNLPDNLIYEVTYSGANRDLNVDVYDKIDSVRIKD